MDAFALEKPLVDGGLRLVNFFNGRLLTANDLRREQEARHIVDAWLGEAIGDGVAYGLEVSMQAQSTLQEPMVTIEPGLAVNRQGHALYLRSQATLALLRKSPLAALEAGDFAQCGVLQGGTYVAGAGLYLLTIAPASAKEGKAPTTGFDQFGGKCNTDAIVETVQFRLLPVPDLEFEEPGADALAESVFRSQVAGRFIGAGDAERARPLGVPMEDPVVKLTGASLSSCDVPLALIYWTLDNGIRFIDQWAVRRAITQPNADKRWSPFLEPRRQIESEAFSRQFQAHLATLLSNSAIDAASLTADLAFAWLPPAGVLPVGAGALSWQTFLGPMAPPATKDVDQGLLRALLERALPLEPVPIPDFQNAAQPGQRPMPIDVYRIPEITDYFLFARATSGRARVLLSPEAAKKGATVILTRVNPPVATTAVEVNGAFVAADLEPGHYTIDVNALGFVAASDEDDVCAGRTLEIGMQLIELPKGALLVSLVNANNEEAIIDANASVTAVSNSGSFEGSFESGKWKIQALAPGAYDLAAKAAGYEARTAKDVIVSPDGTATYELQMAPIPEPGPQERLCTRTSYRFVKPPRKLVKGVWLCPQLKQTLRLTGKRGEFDDLIDQYQLALVELDAKDGQGLLTRIRDWLIDNLSAEKEDVINPSVYAVDDRSDELRKDRRSLSPRLISRFDRLLPANTIAIAVFGRFVVPLASKEEGSLIE